MSAVRNLIQRLRRLEVGASPDDAPKGVVGVLHLPANGRDLESPDLEIRESAARAQIVLYEPTLDEDRHNTPGGSGTAAPPGADEEHGGATR